MIIHVFNPLLNQSATILAFFWPFWKPLAPRFAGESVWKLYVIQTTTLPYNFVQISRISKRLVCGFVWFWRTKRKILNIPNKKNYQLFNNIFICQLQFFYKARRIASKVYRIENGRQKEFYLKEKQRSNHVTKQTWVLFSSDDLSVAMAFQKMLSN